MRRTQKTQIYSEGNFNRIRKENEEMKKRIKRLERRIDKLKKEKKKVEKDFKEYQARHPETVGVKHGKPYAILANSKSSTRKGRGAIKGHKGHYRQRPNDFTFHETIKADRCPHCHDLDVSPVLHFRFFCRI